MNILGLVVARSGSKRLPKKNISAFLGKPLIEWTYECLSNCKKLQNNILSTDDTEAIRLAENFDISVPFVRPSKFSTDESTAFDVINHCLGWLSNKGKLIPDWIILLEPTSPGRQPFHIEDVIKIIESHGNSIDSICGVSKAVGNNSAYKALNINKENLIETFVGDSFSEIMVRNQLVQPSYYINSVIYAFKSEIVLNSSFDLWGSRVFPYLVDEKYVCDIDSKEDFILAESKVSLLREYSSE